MIVCFGCTVLYKNVYYPFDLHCVNNIGQLSPHELAALNFYLKCKRFINFLQISPLLHYSVKNFAIKQIIPSLPQNCKVSEIHFMKIV